MIEFFPASGSVEFAKIHNRLFADPNKAVAELLENIGELA
jgi:hypothetical protein